jgi:predicted naringenin-chalcone synthase
MLADQTSSVVASKRIAAASNRRTIYLTGFQAIAPRFRSTQEALLDWLIAAHARSGGIPRESMKSLFTRYGASPEQIASRGHELADFTHQRWEDMRLFGGERSDIGRKMEFFDESVNSIFERLYPLGAAAPRNIVHVTCTGYSAPSGAQRLVSARRWGEKTQVLHAYHMGCYAAHPALRMAAGILASSPDSANGVDIVHTELCSLHLDPTNHEPAQLVIQSLFADGFIKYRVGSADAAQGSPCGETVLELLAARDVIVPDSTKAMRWATGPLVFEMELSKEVPILFASALPRFAASLFQEAGLDFADEKPSAVFAVHPGGPRIIELSERILNLRTDQTAWSRAVLRERGNMSSATLPYIWHHILNDSTLPDDTLVVSIGAGPGLTLSGALFRKRIS